jgi:pectin methylesterase-like acyl-CoA thioesterase
METEIKEEKQLVLKRVPPGDRWIFAKAIPGGIQGDVHPSLTDALEAWFQYTGETNFYIDAKKGTVEVVKQEEIEVPVKRFSLYGED